MFNQLAFNPAYAGSRNATSFTALYRHQWQGIEGAPKTVSFNMHTPLQNKRIALGFQLTNDRIGITNTTGIFGDYAYRIPMGGGYFSMGVQAGVHFYNMSLVDAVSFNPADGALSSNFQKWLPNFGAGLYYYNSNMFVGVSAPRLIENSLAPKNMTAGEDAEQRRHYFATAGYMITFTENVKFRPSIMLKYADQTPFQADINGSLLFAEKLWIGAAYRTNSSYNFNVEWNLTEQLRLGYAYDFVLGKLGEQTFGTHEILLGYDLDFNRDKIITPRTISPRYF